MGPAWSTFSQGLVIPLASSPLKFPMLAVSSILLTGTFGCFWTSLTLVRIILDHDGVLRERILFASKLISNLAFSPCLLPCHRRPNPLEKRLSSP